MHLVGLLWFVAPVLLPVAAVFLMPRGGQSQRDPERIFSLTQRKQGMLRCGNRCELGVFRRCTRYGFHGDHWFPWSKGGATTARNMVIACETCNKRKSNKSPTVWHTWRVQARRRSYFPKGVDCTVGEWARVVR